MKRFPWIIFLLSVPCLAAAESGNTSRAICQDLTVQLQAVIDHVNDPLDWVTTDTTDRSTIGKRLHQQARHADRVLADIDSAIAGNKVSGECKDRLQRQEAAFHDRKRQVSLLLKEQFDAFVQ